MRAAGCMEGIFEVRRSALRVSSNAKGTIQQCDRARSRCSWLEPLVLSKDFGGKD